MDLDLEREEQHEILFSFPDWVLKTDLGKLILATIFTLGQFRSALSRSPLQAPSGV